VMYETSGKCIEGLSFSFLFATKSRNHETDVIFVFSRSVFGIR